MTQLNQIYKCNVCGNIVEVLHAAGGQLVCCSENMELLKEKEEDEGLEKHVPIIEQSEGVVKVRVGSVPHPMTSEHHIEWVEMIDEAPDDQEGSKVFLEYLHPGDDPEVKFCCIPSENIKVRAYCNVHGLWKS